MDVGHRKPIHMQRSMLLMVLPYKARLKLMVGGPETSNVLAKYDIVEETI